ncbi:phage tail tube protein [Sphingomonas sanxanigenens]|uniref:Lambda phage tail tube protein N-terminal domain-containing protein n=1 Tax=Sphingomonas sanxanigenens DSM 19645 = NX02 TaxID=1123269 RepID=W0ANX0_9SPHN|nr:phage tail tube protein [Sphingomonas sanxanigenens]AHE57430.1 hypothetical protein NX02_29330 [Sphingomonas sanxanigenens DSM 19645 = NX02]
MAETVAETDIGFLTKLKKLVSPGVYVEFAEINDMTLPEMARDSVEFTHYSSPDGYREYKPGLTDPGEGEFVYNLVPGKEDDAIVLTHIAARLVEGWRIEYPDGATFDFRGFVTSHQHATPLEDRMTGAMTIKISGKPVFVPAA